MKLVLDLEFYKNQLICVGNKFGNNKVCVDQFVPSYVLEALANPEIIKVCHSKTDWRWLQENGYKLAGKLEDTMVKAWVLDENTPLTLDYCAMRYAGITMDKRIKQVANEPLFRCDDGTYVHIKDAPIEQVMVYNKEDVEATIALNDALDTKLDQEGWAGYYEAEQRPFTEVVLAMETNGLPFNPKKAEKLRRELVPALEHQSLILDTILKYPLRTKDGKPGYGSSKLLRQVLFSKAWSEPARWEHGLELRKPNVVSRLSKDKGIKKSEVTNKMVEDHIYESVEYWKPPGLQVEKISHKYVTGTYVRRGYGLPETPPADPEKDTGPSTAMPMLLSHFPDHPFILALRDWAKTRKVITTYLDAYPKFTHIKNGQARLHGTFSQTGTVTGRLSSARPNLMNQPSHGPLGEKIRGLFEGWLLIGDYSQLEPRLMAHFSQDPKLLEVYEKGLDIYAVTASGIFGGKHQDYPESSKERKMSKPLFLGDQYGAGYKKLWTLMRLNGFDVSTTDVKLFQNRLHSHFGVLTSWKENVAKEARRKGYVETLDGHRRRLSHQFRGGWKNRGYGERQAVNAIIQGSAGDVVRRAMVMAHNELPELKLLAQVHDEVLFEPKHYMTTKEVNEIIMELRYIFEVGHGFNLSVPLVFQPTVCNTWADKGVEGIEWPHELEGDNDES